MEKLILSHGDCLCGAIRIANLYRTRKEALCLYGIPRGGIPVAYLLSSVLPNSLVVESPEKADIIVDDIIDSGRTQKHYADRFPHIPFHALCDHIPSCVTRPKGQWVVFPWEVGRQGEDTSAEDAVVRLLQYVGEDVQREGLKETPARVLKAWKHWTSGYGQDPKQVLKSFADGGEKYDEMIVEKNIPFYSSCEHHLAPFFGSVTIAYVPNGRVAGLSKLVRLVDIFARRLQVQERLTVQIADALNDALTARGAGVSIDARHLCMESRGVCRQGQTTVTTALRGVFLEDPRARYEFLNVLK